MRTNPTTETLNDARLVELSRTGDRDAFGRIVERYQSLICALTYSASGNLQASEDLAQVTFITAWCQLRNLREPAKVKSWLCRIARNATVDSFRQNERTPTSNAEALDTAANLATNAPTPRDHVISKEEEAILWRSLGELPPTYREPLILFYRQHQSVAEVAAALELSEDTVKQRLSRGRAMLAEQVAAFVEGTLKRSTPGKVFTVGVLAALPVLMTSATAATAALSGAAHHSTTTIRVTKAIVMTTTQKVLIAVTAASVAVAVGTGVHETRRASRMQEEIRTLKQQPEPFTAQVQQLRQERDQARRNLSALQRQNEQPRNRAAQLQAPAAPASTGTASNSPDPLPEMMKDPKMKEMIRAQGKAMLDRQYGSLAKYLNLPPERMDALKSLLYDRQMALADSEPAMMGGSKAERKQAAEDSNAIKAEYDQKIKDLLGPQDYQTFQDYEKTNIDRFQMQMFKGSLPAAAALTDQQEYDLLNVMYQARLAMPSSSLVIQSDPSQLTDENIAEAMKQMEQLQQVYADGAKGILTPTQYEEFIKWQRQMISLQAVTLIMSQQRFGNKGAAQPPAGNQTQTH